MNTELGNNFFLRPFNISDVSSLAEFANNIEISKNLREAFPSPYTEKDAEEWIKLSIAADPPAHFAITDADKCIGCIGLTLQEDIFSHSAEIGFWLAQPYWGKGICTSAAKKMIFYGFRELGLARIFAYVFKDNPGSVHVLENCGMKLEGILKNGALKKGIVHDLFLYAITKY